MASERIEELEATGTPWDLVGAPWFDLDAELPPTERQPVGSAMTFAADPESVIPPDVEMPQ